MEVIAIKAKNVASFRRRHDLVIIDDFFPCLATAFRVAEFNSIFDHFRQAVLFSASKDMACFSSYAQCYPQFASRIHKFHSARRLNGSGAYLVFLNNIFGYLAYLEKYRLPFVFELYPGGGFYIDDAVSDAHLRKVFSSTMFRKVIVTQNITRDYLLKKGLCREQQIELIFGVVVLSNMLSNAPGERSHFGFDKNVLDICFVANKYMPGGLDKGYDRFIACAELLCKRNSQIRFHVVGNFNEGDIEISSLLHNRINFYGPRVTAFFPGFYANMDLMLSPNVPFVFGPGAFDGFPTGCCIEAALCGTALFMCDELQLNGGRLTDGKEVVLIPRDPQGIVEIIDWYIQNPPNLRLLAANGQQAVRNLFDLEIQMAPRLRVLSELLRGS
jgi:glycosyltransferase involved in cell wall biosynthesis